jgi:tetratricopeptide (TPR) repeat protein
LLQGDKGQRVPQLTRFGALLAAGQPLADSFQQAFQMDFATMEKELRKYVQNDSYRVQFFTSERPLDFDADMQTAPLTEAEAQAYLGDLLYHANRAADAEPYLQQALTLNPDLAMAHATLGMVRVREQRYDEAIKSLEQAVKLNPQNYLAHYYLAEALNRRALGPQNMVTRFPAETAATMRAELKRAIELNPNFAEAYSLLGFVDMVNEEELPDASIRLLHALQLKPDRLQYAIWLAEVYMRREQFDPARNILQKVLRSPNADGQARAQARQVLQELDAYAEQLARIKAYNAQVAAQVEAQRNERPTLLHRGEGESAGKPPTDAPLTAEDFKPRIKRRTDGEQVRGVLTKIECAGGQSVVFYVQAADKLYKFHADRFDQVELVAYVPDMGGTEIGCGPIKKELYVILTFHPAAKTGAKFDGEAIALDLITKDMEVEP